MPVSALTASLKRSAQLKSEREAALARSKSKVQKKLTPEQEARRQRILENNKRRAEERLAAIQSSDKMWQMLSKLKSDDWQKLEDNVRGSGHLVGHLKTPKTGLSFLFPSIWHFQSEQVRLDIYDYLMDDSDSEPQSDSDSQSDAD